jgi:two-component system sensor histidine kinase HydH
VSAETLPDDLLRDLRLDAAAAARLRALHAAIAPHAARLIDELGGPAAGDAERPALAAWLEQLLLGPHEGGNGERAASGHARALLAHRARALLAPLVDELHPGDEAARRETAAALHRRLDREVAFLLADGARTAPARDTLGQLAASIGHELRTPLSVMESSLYLARRRLGELGGADPRVEQHLEKIAAEVRRAQKTIDDLLGLARGQPPRRERVALASVAARALERLPAAEGAPIAVELPSDLGVDADPDQLAQVLANLVLNAQQALAGGGQITIEGGRAGAGAWLRVRDDGPGISCAIREHLFTPFFTTKARGSGLGLALCRRIVEAHGGTVVLEAGEAGASFLVTLPDP